MSGGREAAPLFSYLQPPEPGVLRSPWGSVGLRESLCSQKLPQNLHRVRVPPAPSACFPGLRSQRARAACVCHAQIAPVACKLIQSNL